MLTKSDIRKVNRVIEIAKAVKINKATGRAFHCTAIYDKTRILSIGFNNYNKPHPEKKFGKYSNTKFGKKYCPCLHSEISALLNLGEQDCSKYTFVNVRIDNNGEVTLAKPCSNCFKTITEQVGFKSIFYTNSIGEIEIINN